eukprot:CAMPEP_0183739336 /NCGR_PEP_ID=MMETSP0737-20130205/56798_1 /TAXON_ID=385413 /ORGANISM="Thalassiosira miniscula, Strain CCMP1093" /LENGTH=119 /DNA_ID=CAMNT_0025974111 /DNA_START=15 /DNA_END=371 /DNA_ORIENTATION=-
MTSEGCFENVHPDHMSVYHFTNNTGSEFLDIPSFGSTGTLVYPTNEPMSTFEDLKDNSALATYVGRYGDKMKVDDFTSITGLSSSSSTVVAVANNLSSPMVIDQIDRKRGGGILICGSI